MRATSCFQSCNRRRTEDLLQRTTPTLSYTADRATSSSWPLNNHLLHPESRPAAGQKVAQGDRLAGPTGRGRGHPWALAQRCWSPAAVKVSRTDLRAWTRLRSENSWRSTKAFRVWRWSSSLEESVSETKHEQRVLSSPSEAAPAHLSPRNSPMAVLLSPSSL